ncbi:exodeoxyribonuclease VII large subunit [Tuberibacillus sp. Marseille-P3662]|uniref:exodeoxyribonuclease VII large subunit n=1 Tax=Tuberibacillus sp. Marseille-P3662 TaxID=1965358 RepID=UPI000A1CAC24|nr:exodeoxyribonuclease VII large subunit [Tuberibacillus sp. Marseille-P3662]
MVERRYISVSALTRYVKRRLENDRHLKDVWLRGEISNFKHHSRGHMYLTLKDQGSRVSAVMFARNNRRLPFKPENGMKVLVHGDVSVYEPYGQYQFYIKDMQQDGIGNLYLAFEQLKKKLQTEGLFDPALKQPLPSYPKEIAVVTSPTGAAIRDMFSTIKRRFPAARITVFPVHVQGEYAAPSIVQAIAKINQLGCADVIIMGRGGGSIEELWAFNEESVARAIYQSLLPIISAVGHETDYTIADFVSDVRAATPTGAGELVVPHIQDIQERINDRVNRLFTAMNQKISREKERLIRLRQSYAFKYPTQLVRQKEQDLDHSMERLLLHTRNHVRSNREALNRSEQLINKHHPEEQIKHLRGTLQQYMNRLNRNMKVIQQTKATELNNHIRQLQAYSPLNVMARGFTLTYNENDDLVKSVKKIAPGQAVRVKFQDGMADCQVWGIEEEDDS